MDIGIFLPFSSTGSQPRMRRCICLGAREAKEKQDRIPASTRVSPFLLVGAEEKGAGGRAGRTEHDAW